MNKKWDFLKEVTDIDDRFIEEAAGEWIQPVRNVQQILVKIPFKIIRYITREYETPDANVLGDVEFTFSASRKELQASAKSVETDIKVKLRNNTEVQVQKVRVSKVASRITIYKNLVIFFL